MPITVEELLEELFKTIDIQCGSITFKAISGSVQHTRTITIRSLGMLVRCLAAFEWFCIELEEPIIVENEASPFRIGSITILLQKVDHVLQIRQIYTDEEEIFPETDWIERAKRRLMRWKPAIDLIITISRVFEFLVDRSTDLQGLDS